MRRAAGNSSIQLLTLALAVAMTPEQQQIRAVGDAFESLMLQRLYDQMKSANQLLNSGDDSPFAPGRGEEIFQGMRDEMMLKATAQRRPLGISDMVVRQLGGAQIPREEITVTVE